MENVKKIEKEKKNLMEVSDNFFGNVILNFASKEITVEDYCGFLDENVKETLHSAWCELQNFIMLVGDEGTRTTLNSILLTQQTAFMLWEHIDMVIKNNHIKITEKG